MPHRFRNSWVSKLPSGLRDQPGWVFIGTLVALAGLSYLFGFSNSTATQVVSALWLRTWGGLLFISGALVVISTIRANKPLEKLALRVQSISLFVYMVWVLSAISFSRATLTVALCVCLIGLSEIRIAVLKALMRPLPESVRTVAE